MPQASGWVYIATHPCDGIGSCLGKDRALTLAVAEVALSNAMLSKMSQAGKATCHMIHTCEVPGAVIILEPCKDPSPSLGWLPAFGVEIL